MSFTRFVFIWSQSRVTTLHTELFIDLAPLGRVKSGPGCLGTASHIMDSSGALLLGDPPVSDGWRAFLRILLGVGRGFAGSQMISNPNLHR